MDTVQPAPIAARIESLTSFGFHPTAIRQQIQADIAAARSSAKAPKTVNDYFKGELTNKLMILCDVVVETDLPDVWIDLASNGGKRDRETIELGVNSKAAKLRMQDSAPIVTPNLAKKTTTLRLEGTNMDNLEEGVNPF
jgi:hypothetical protein